MKTIIIVLLFSINGFAADLLFSCAPEGGQLPENKDLYITYVLESQDFLKETPNKQKKQAVEEIDPSFTYSFRKEYLGNNDDSALEKTVYGLGLMYFESESGFELGYEAGGDIFLMAGQFSKPPLKNEEVLVKALLLLEFKQTVAPLLGLMEPPEDIERWQCLVNLKQLRKFTIKNEAVKQQIIQLKKRLGAI